MDLLTRGLAVAGMIGLLIAFSRLWERAIAPRIPVPDIPMPHWLETAMPWVLWPAFGALVIVGAMVNLNWR